MKDATRFTLKRLVVPMAIVFAIALMAFVFLCARADPLRRPDFDFEAAKAALTVMAGVLITGVVAFIVKSYETHMKQLVEREELQGKRHRLLRTDLLDGVTTLYFRTKSVRRRLRASITTDGRIDATKYDELMQELNEAQLGLERFVAQAEKGAAQHVVPSEVPKKLGSMESYLGELVSEYEESAGAGETLATSDMDALQDFIGLYRKSRFRSEFVHPYRDANSAVALADQQSSPLTNR